MTTSVLTTTNASFSSNVNGTFKSKDCNTSNNDSWAEALLDLRASKPPKQQYEPKFNDDNLVGLDALAVLCSSAACIEEDPGREDEITPVRRQRSCSNPEGMEKWEAMSRIRYRECSYTPPPSILEEDEEGDSDMTEVANSLSLLAKDRITPDLFQSQTVGGTSTKPIAVTPDEIVEDPAELLRRARSKLLEDMHECSSHSKGASLILPHSLTKYRELYNKNGRIGIYTPAERAAIISRFHGKRSRRVWNKKIRYNCRKNLADRRMRVKGRFVKRSSEEAATTLVQVATTNTNTTVTPMEKIDETEVNIIPPPSDDHQMEEDDKNDLPDANDEEAGFEPTVDQPFRRARRHTIT